VKNGNRIPQKTGNWELSNAGFGLVLLVSNLGLQVARWNRINPTDVNFDLRGLLALHSALDFSVAVLAHGPVEPGPSVK
jgi:hypothetical protein